MFKKIICFFLFLFFYIKVPRGMLDDCNRLSAKQRRPSSTEKFVKPVPFIVIASFLILSLTVSLTNGQIRQESSIIDIDWEFKNILILPAGCLWARNITWRVRMKCPAGHFYVPTRVQASTNKAQFCDFIQQTNFSTEGSSDNSTTTPSPISTVTFNESNGYSFQLKSDDSLLKGTRRRFASKLFGDGRLNRYDYPYFPIYASRQATYWDCVGSNAETCSFLVNSSEYLDTPASHGDLHLATLVLPGPYCSTIDSFEHYERASGGTVYTTANSTGNIGVTKLNDAHFIDAYDEPVELIPPNANDVNAHLARWPDLKQSENIYFVGRGLYNSSRQVLQCFATLVPRDAAKARSLWAKNRTDFRKSIVANFHVNFIQLTYNGYSTFYDDMTGLAHDSKYWRGMFEFTDLVELSGGSVAIKMAFNFNLSRLSDSQPVRIGLVLYEILVVGDEAAKLLGAAWPYRYSSRTRESSRRLILLRHATIDRCFDNAEDLVADFAPIVSKKKFQYQEVPLAAGIKIYSTPALVQPDDDEKSEVAEIHSITSENPNGNRFCPHYWCIWLWIALAAFVIVVIVVVTSIILLFHFRRPRQARYSLERRRQEVSMSTDEPALLVASSQIEQAGSQACGASTGRL